MYCDAGFGEQRLERTSSSLGLMLQRCLAVFGFWLSLVAGAMVPYCKRVGVKGAGIGLRTATLCCQLLRMREGRPISNFADRGQCATAKGKRLSPDSRESTSLPSLTEPHNTTSSTRISYATSPPEPLYLIMVHHHCKRRPRERRNNTCAQRNAKHSHIRSAKSV